MVQIIIFLSLFTITREEIICNAKNYANHSWYCADYNSTLWDSLYSTYGCPLHQTCDFNPSEIYMGEAYGYGQNDSYWEFDSLLECSLAAGNHYCHYIKYDSITGIHPPDWAAGIDCSAFICRCWEVPRVGTWGLYTDYDSIGKEEVEMGDILVKPGSHAVLIEDPGDSPPTGTFSLYESSGSQTLLCYNPLASWSEYSDYSARTLFKTGVASKPSPSLISNGWLKCFPNPFHTSTVISLECIDHVDAAVTRSQHSIRIYDTSGRLIRTFVNKSLTTNYQLLNTVLWDGKDRFGRKLPCGIYLIRAESENYKKTVKVVKLK